MTASTYLKAKLFDTPHKLDLLHDSLLEIAERHGWDLQAWAVFANHYHFVGVAPEEDDPVRHITSAIHRKTSSLLNDIDGVPGRQVWFRCRQTRLTFERSHLARMNYVMLNPSKHGMAADPERYPWCSLAWFKREASRPFSESVLSLDVSLVNVPDDF